MGAGFQVFNDSNFLQIDADYSNHEFVTKGTYSIGPSNLANGGSNIGSTTVTVAGRNPVIALNSSSLCYASLQSQSGGVFTFYIYNGENTTVSGEYFIFDTASDASAGNTGMQIFNAAGKLVFDSNKKYMKVLDYFDSTVVSEDQTRSYAKKVAFVMSDFGYRFVVQSSPTQPGNSSVKFLQSWLHLGSTPNGSQFRLKDTTTFTNANADAAGQVATSEYPSRWMILDVSLL